MMTDPQRRRWHYSLRALFVAVTLCGASLGWLGAQFHWIQDRDEALRWVHDLRGRQIAAENGSPVPPVRGEVNHDGARAPWSLRILGTTGVARLDVYRNYLSPSSRYSLAELGCLFPEADVNAVAPRATAPAAGKEQIVFEVQSNTDTPSP
jgi:hypothetical protein